MKVKNKGKSPETLIIKEDKSPQGVHRIYMSSAVVSFLFFAEP